MEFAADAIVGRSGSIINVRLRRSGGGKESDAALVNTEDGMVDESVVSWDGGDELDDSGTSWRDDGGLNVSSWRRSEIAFTVDFVEDGADNVESRGEIGSSVTEEDSDAFSDFG